MERKPPDKDEPLLEFYKDGKLLRRVTVGEVVKDEDLVIKKLDGSDSNDRVPFEFTCGWKEVDHDPGPYLGSIRTAIDLENAPGKVARDEDNRIGDKVISLITEKLGGREGIHDEEIFIFHTISGERLYFNAKTGELLYRYHLSDKSKGFVPEPKVDYPEVEWIEIPNGPVKPPAEQSP